MLLVYRFDALGMAWVYGASTKALRTTDSLQVISRIVVLVVLSVRARSCL